VENPIQIDIQSRNFSLTDALRSHAERRLRFTLTCYDDHILRIVMRLSDINGPRGGTDKRCHLQVVLSGLSDVVIEDTEADLYVAIDRATDRAGRTLIRRKLFALSNRSEHHAHQCLKKAPPKTSFYPS
jgi:ribosomal subunit interface protein